MIFTQNKTRFNRFTTQGLILFLLISLCIGLFPKDMSAQIWTTYTTGNSPIANDVVTEVKLDYSGQVWFGHTTGNIGPNNSTPISIKDGANWNSLSHNINGLPSGSSSDLISMPNGDLWLGAGKTLTEWAGSNYTYYQPPTTTYQTSSVDTDAVGNIWITGFGLSKFDGTNWTQYTASNSGLVSDFALDVEADGGTIWTATSIGLSKLVGTTWTTYNTGNSGIPTNYIKKVKSDGAGGVYVATNFGLGHLSNLNVWTTYNTGNSGLPHNTVNDILIDSGGDLWVSTNGGVSQYNGSIWTTYTTSNSNLSDNRGHGMTEEGGDIYVATYDARLNRFNGTGWVNYTTNYSTGFFVSNVTSDAAGNVWMCAGNYGYFKFDGSQITQFTPNNTNFHLNQVNNISFWGTGDPTIATGYGAARYAGGNWTIYNSMNAPFALDDVQHAVWSQNTGIWVLAGGLYRYDNNTWTTVTTANSGIPSNAVYALESNCCSIWVGTNAGLARFDGTNWTVYNTSNSPLAFNFVTKLDFGPQSDLSIVSQSGITATLQKIDYHLTNNWTTYPSLQGPVHDVAYSDSTGMWIGTSYGAYNFKNNTWTHYTSSNSGLPQDSVLAVAVDSMGVAWFGTYGGGARFGPSTPINLGNDTTLCPGDSLVLDAGPNFSSYLWSTGDTTQTITVNSPATYSVTAIDQNGATSNDVIIISAGPAGPVNINLGPDTLVCTATQLSLDAGNNPGLLYSWTGGASTQSITVNTTGWYSVFALDGCGNVSYDSIHVTFGVGNPAVILDSLQPNFPAMPRDTLLCADTMWVYVAPPPSCTTCQITWSAPQNLYGINITQSGSYSVILDDGNGCLTYDTLDVTMDTACVWPGDANYDNVANNVDVLSVGLAFGNPGAARQAPYNDNQWYAHPTPDWSTAFNNGANHKHADCDGNGVVQQADVNVINLNYGLTHNKGLGSSGGPGDPDLYFYQLQDTAQAGDTLTFMVALGRDTLPADSIYGIAFTFNYDPGLIDSASVIVNYDSSWLGTLGTDLISLDRDFYGAGKTEIGISRTDQLNRNGYGRIASISVVVQDDVAGKDFLYKDLGLAFSNVTMISNTEELIPVNLDSGTVVIYQFVESREETMNWNSVKVYPNPANEQVTLITEHLSLNKVEIVDLQGRLLLAENWGSTQHRHTIKTGSFSPGIYFLRFTDGNLWETRKLIIKR